MTPLRRRMLEDMQMRNLSINTQKAYLRAVAQLAQHYKQSPEQLSTEQVRAYLVHLINERHASPSLYNQARCALKFFFQVTLDSAEDYEVQELYVPLSAVSACISGDSVTLDFSYRRESMTYRSLPRVFEW